MLLSNSFLSGTILSLSVQPKISVSEKRYKLHSFDITLMELILEFLLRAGTFPLSIKRR